MKPAPDPVKESERGVSPAKDKILEEADRMMEEIPF